MATNLVFFGSPQFSADILESIIHSLRSTVSVVGVVTNPDRPYGRKQVLTPSPVALIAQKHHLPTFRPGKLDSANLAHINLLKPDLFLTCAYGKIVPDIWLTTPRIKPLNLHFSLLPKYRGALCIQEALKNGDHQTGVTLMEMTSELDAGPIISQQSTSIDLNDNIQTLQTKLTQTAIELLAEALPKYISGQLHPTPQNDSLAVSTPSLTTINRQSAYIPWDSISSALNGKGSFTVHNLIRSKNPEPGAWTTIDGQDIKIITTRLADEHSNLTIETVQLPGKSPISWSEFLSGHRVSAV